MLWNCPNKRRREIRGGRPERGPHSNKKRTLKPGSVVNQGWGKVWKGWKSVGKRGRMGKSRAVMEETGSSLNPRKTGLVRGGAVGSI